MLHLVLSWLTPGEPTSGGPTSDGVTAGVVSALPAPTSDGVGPDAGGSSLPIPTPDGPADTSFAATLERAKDAYFRGEAARARELLEGLQLRLYAGEKPSWDQVVDAMTYLGEIYYVAGNQEQAEIAFHYVLDQDASAPISPYSHPVDVVNLFELVRATVVKTRVPVPIPKPRPPPTPVWVFSPFGIPQFAQRRPVAGIVYGGLQSALGIGSIAMRVHLDEVNPRDLLEPQQEPVDQLLREKFAYQWGATFGFYVVWGISTIDAARFHQRHPPALQLGVTPEGTPTMGVGGTW